MRLAFVSSALTVLALTSALAQTPVPPPNPGATAPGTSASPGAQERGGRANERREQSAGAMPAPHQAGPNTPDQIFLTRATRCGLAQIELARLAEQKASSPSVREFARQMIMDHEQANRSLRALAEGDGAAVPDQIEAEYRQARDDLGRLSGAEFDIEYLRLQVPAHQRMATLMEYVIGSGEDAQVRGYASSALPKVFTHLAMASQLLDQTSMQNPQIAGAPPRKVSGMPTPQTPRANAN
jgi:putative membrane protein